MTVGQLEEQLTEQEFMKWRLLESIEPWGEVGLSHRAACLMATLEGVMTTSKKPIRISDIMNKFFRPRKRQTPAQMMKVVKRMAAAYRKGK